MVTRYQHGAPEGEPHSTSPALPDSANMPTSRVYEGAVRWGALDGETVQHGVSRHQVSFNGTAGGSIMATKQSVGGKDTVELIPGDPSSRTLLSLAVKDGLIEQHLPGVYRDVPRDQQPPQSQEPHQGPQEAPGAHFDAEDEALWSEDIQPLPQHAYDAAVSSVIGAIAHGKGSLDDTAKALAANAGLEPALAAEYVREGTAMYERTVARAVAPMGLQGDRLEAFYDFAREQTGLQDALQKLVHYRDVSGFTALAVAFKRTNPGDLSTFTNAGFETHIDQSTGDVLVRRKGGEWRRAADL